MAMTRGPAAFHIAGNAGSRIGRCAVSRRVSWAAVAAVAATIACHPQAWAAEEVKEPAEASESVVSSPPMEMDDPGTPGPRGIEVNFVGTLVRLGPGRSSESLFDANYGIGERLQLKYERPYLTEHADGAEFQKGL